ncbi:MAG: hypothetical protein Kow00128_23280 [Deltaproteobacteria bacterium]
MDTVTHGLAGWLIARAVPDDTGKRTAAAAVIAGALLPDLDHAASLLGSEPYLRLHRGLSHSFAGVAVSSLLVALLFHRFGKWKDWRKLYLLTLLGQLSHIALDLLNSYGTQIFQPFSNARVSLDLLFVVDLLFTGIVAAGIILSRRRPAPARAALAVLFCYVGVAALLHGRAEEAVRTAAVRGGVPVVSSAALPRLGEIPIGTELSRLRWAGEAWAREELTGLPAIPIPEHRNRIPFPAGPFAWNGFVDDGRTYLRAEVDPFTETVAWKQRVLKGDRVAASLEVEKIPDVRTYLWFARFPAVSSSRDGEARVLSFYDLRFGEVPGRRRPFRLEVIESPGHTPRVRWER